MASIDRNPVSGRFYIRFRYGRKQYQQTIRTTNRKEAEAIRGRVLGTIMLLEQGRLEIPADADIGTYILSDGKRNGKPVTATVRTLGDLFRMYRQQRQTGAKEDSTIEGEDRHIKHLRRHLKPSRIAQNLIVGDLQRYVALRSKDKWNGKTISPESTEKEVRTFRLIWNWGVRHGHVHGAAPIKGIEYPKIDEKPPFLTWDDFERIVSRGGLSEDEQRELCDCLFLRIDRDRQFLGNGPATGSVALHPPDVCVCCSHRGTTERNREVED